LTYLERQKCYGPDKKILLKKQLFDLEFKGQGPTKVIAVCDTPPYGLLSEACPDHNLFVFPDRSIIFGMWVQDHNDLRETLTFDLKVK
jgi:hypothetical protein